MTGMLGRGRIRKVRNQAGQWVYQGDWVDAAGGRHRKELAPDKRTADRLLAEIVRKRDMALAGLGAEVGQERRLAAIKHLYIADLKSRRSAAYATRTDGCLANIIPGVSGGRCVR